MCACMVTVTSLCSSICDIFLSPEIYIKLLQITKWLKKNSSGVNLVAQDAIYMHKQVQNLRL